MQSSRFLSQLHGFAGSNGCWLGVGASARIHVVPAMPCGDARHPNGVNGRSWPFRRRNAVGKNVAGGSWKACESFLRAGVSLWRAHRKAYGAAEGNGRAVERVRGAGNIRSPRSLSTEQLTRLYARGPYLRISVT